MVTNEPDVIHIDPDSELGRALENSERAVVLVSKNKRFIVSPGLATPGSSFDPERFLRVLHDAAGSISPEEAERWKEQIYRAREEGSRPITRP
ncbi:MAG: hypothetical protein U0075_16345 [Thermomicrobiales bacterium]